MLGGGVMEASEWGDLLREDQIRWVEREATWQELVDLLAEFDQECVPELGEGVGDLLLNGCKGYRNMTRAELVEEIRPMLNEPVNPADSDSDDGSGSGGEIETEEVY